MKDKKKKKNDQIVEAIIYRLFRLHYFILCIWMIKKSGSKMYVMNKSPWIENHFYNSDDYERFREKMKEIQMGRGDQFGVNDVEKVNTWAGPIRPRIYGEELQSLCDKTEANLNRLQIQSLKRSITPCDKYGISHMHAESRPHDPDKDRHSKYRQLLEAKNNVRWNDAGVMFTNGDLFENFGNVLNEDRETELEEDKKAAPNTFCYLCSTLEEHQRRHLHKPVTPKRKKKPRAIYIAPPPTLKEPEEPEEKQEFEALYKVVVWTGNRTHAGTDAKVYIKIKGSEDMLQRTRLSRGFGSVHFSFTAGSKEIFYLKSPHLGHLESLSIEHDGLERRHSWFLEKIEVTDIRNNFTWVFLCDQWLSLHAADFKIKRILPAKEKEAPKIGYEIVVSTGKKRFAGTDAEVFLTIYGTEGRNSSKIHLKNKTQKCFERGSVDKFQVVLEPLGDLRKIRIEHDGTGFAPGWYLDKVEIINLEDSKKHYHFIYGGWLASDVGEGLLWREIKGIKKLPRELKSGRKVRYDIKVLTGNVKYAGTDADVTIQMLGERGCTDKLLLDDEKNNFERGMTDNFTLQAFDVGPIYEIKIGHDNSGVGAGWFLDEVTISKYLAKEEALERMRKTQTKHKKKKEKLRIKRGETDEKKQEDSDSEPSSMSDSEDEDRKEKIKQRKLRLKSKRKKSKKDRDDDEYEDLASRYKVPLYDVYHFTCKRWLAKDEDDGLYMRTLTPDSTKTYFEDPLD